MVQMKPCLRAKNQFCLSSPPINIPTVENKGCGKLPGVPLSKQVYTPVCKNGVYHLSCPAPDYQGNAVSGYITSGTCSVHTQGWEMTSHPTHAGMSMSAVGGASHTLSRY